MAAEVGRGELKNRLALLHCVSSYPAPPEQANLLSIPVLAERYGVTVGYSNHVIGPEICLAAVALGARVLEVHVTDRREGRTFRDHHLSFEEAELKRLVANVRAVDVARGRAVKQPQPCELDIAAQIRRRGRRSPSEGRHVSGTGRSGVRAPRHGIPGV